MALLLLDFCIFELYPRNSSIWASLIFIINIIFPKWIKWLNFWKTGKVSDRWRAKDPYIAAMEL